MTLAGLYQPVQRGSYNVIIIVHLFALGAFNCRWQL